MALFADLSKIEHATSVERGHTRAMVKKLTREEFASLLTVGNTCAVLEPPAVIPVERSARLVVALGYKAPNDYARQSADSSGIRKQAATATGAALRCSTENQKGLRLELFRRGRLVFTRTGLFQCWGEAPMGTTPTPLSPVGCLN